MRSIRSTKKTKTVEDEYRDAYDYIDEFLDELYPEEEEVVKKVSLNKGEKRRLIEILDFEVVCARIFGTEKDYKSAQSLKDKVVKLLEEKDKLSKKCCVCGVDWDTNTQLPNGEYICGLCKAFKEKENEEDKE